MPAYQPVSLKLRFVNPLKKSLTMCKFNLAGPTLVRNLVIPYPDVKPGGLVKVETQVTPKVPGQQTLIATFSSKELVDIVGSAKVEVYEE